MKKKTQLTVVHERVLEFRAGKADGAEVLEHGAGVSCNIKKSSHSGVIGVIQCSRTKASDVGA